jgi:superoxide reductase
MEEKHYIEWIQLITKDGFYRKFLQPGDKPEALFAINEKPVGAREYCNVHGLLKS